MASQWFDDADEELSWDTRSSSVETGEGDKDISAEDATRFFIGRDGTAWPLPPPEFMPREDILSPEPLDSTERSSFSSECDWSRPGYRVVWSASQWDEGSAEVERTPSTDSTVEASFSDSDDGAWSPCPPYHHSPSSESPELLCQSVAEEAGEQALRPSGQLVRALASMRPSRSALISLVLTEGFLDRLTSRDAATAFQLRGTSDNYIECLCDELQIVLTIPCATG
ncbi:hypothetical protein NUW54_g9494 [Trametes sanguinea]|uniref:Uncharacterized protein n=1 Tax=Trametes sanguinea TaxID=158606 RepID=A0ACC1P7V4_9APHY|nr:hypothetical protein NUW54_g9494 [Trametes sanguinea]